ncbi:hypothetical protein JW916_01210 [Candidatus Sumerlaeota bacterium]|nr:hypothetical protein [Candidatus Sumerlaeota bacterium]
MRFRNFHPHSGRSEEQREERALKSESRVSRAAAEVENRAAREAAPKGSIPIEWRPLSRFIEAGRNVQPPEEYTRSFWSRLLPRLKQVARRDEMVREYLRETFWWRWSLRAAAALVAVAMLYGLFSLHAKNRDLSGQIARLEKEVQVLQAGM